VADPVTKIPTITVRVVCTDRSHQGKTAKIATFQRYVLNGRSLWTRQPVGADNPWDGNPDPRPDAETWHGFAPGAPGLRFTLRCPLCGLDVTARHEMLAPILDHLADAGESCIVLGALAHIVGGASGRA
jgi:hypothetical protein